MRFEKQGHLGHLERLHRVPCSFAQWVHTHTYFFRIAKKDIAIPVETSRELCRIEMKNLVLSDVYIFHLSQSHRLTADGVRFELTVPVKGRRISSALR